MQGEIKKYIKSPLNYTGGKYKLLPQILPLFPDDITDFWDLFCGGANVGINITADSVIYNDINEKLIGLFNTINQLDYEVFDSNVKHIICKYGLSNSNDYSYEYYGCSSDTGLGQYNKEGYMKLRQDFNCLQQRQTNYYIYLFVLIVYAFNNQIRFNSSGQFNLPIGKRDYNSHIQTNLREFKEKLSSQKAIFTSKDFRNIRATSFKTGSFVYCDPPYLISTASYNEMGGWTTVDEKDLLSFLDELNDHKVRFALSNILYHKGRSNELLLEWVPKYNVHKLSFDYSNSSYHTKNSQEKTQEVLITNY